MFETSFESQALLLPVLWPQKLSQCLQVSFLSLHFLWSWQPALHWSPSKKNIVGIKKTTRYLQLLQNQFQFDGPPFPHHVRSPWKYGSWKPLKILTNATWSLFSTFPPFYPLLLSLPPPVTDSPSSPAVGSWKIKVSWVAKQWGMLSLASVYHPSWCSIYKRAISTTHTCLSVLQDSHKIGKLFHLKSTASISPSPFRNDVSLWFIWRCVILNI